MIGFPLDNTEYTAIDLGTFLGTRTRGVFSIDADHATRANGDMTVTVSSGRSLLKMEEDWWGVILHEKNDLLFTIDTPDGQLSRVDVVCIRIDKNANQPEMVIKKGAYSAGNPTFELPVRDLNYDEIYIAAIEVRAGVKNLTQADVTDLRMDERYCGVTKDGIEGLPVQMLIDQWLAKFKEHKDEMREHMDDFLEWVEAFKALYGEKFTELMAEKREEFEDWFEQIRDQLSEDAAGKLWLAIESLKEEVKKIEPKVSSKLDKTEGGTVTGATNFTGTLQNGGNSVLSTNSDGRVYQGSNATPNLNVYGKLQKNGVNVQTQGFGKESMTPYLIGTFRPWNGEGHRFAVSKYGNIVNMHIQLDVLYNLPVTVHPITSRPIPEKYRPYGEPNAVA